MQQLVNMFMKQQLQQSLKSCQCVIVLWIDRLINDGFSEKQLQCCLHAIPKFFWETPMREMAMTQHNTIGVASTQYLRLSARADVC